MKYTMTDMEAFDKASMEITESFENAGKDNTTVWIVSSMLIIWIYVIMASLI